MGATTSQPCITCLTAPDMYSRHCENCKIPYVLLESALSLSRCWRTSLDVMESKNVSLFFLSLSGSIYLFTYTQLSISTSLSIYLYIHTYIHTYTHTHTNSIDIVERTKNNSWTNADPRSGHVKHALHPKLIL